MTRCTQFQIFHKGVWKINQPISDATQKDKSESRPILWWAALGFAFLIVQIYVFSAWILSPDFRPTAPGPDPVPAYVLIGLRAFEVLSMTMAAVTLWWFVRGIRRDGRIDATRLMMIGWLSAYWLDPFLNFLRPMFTYNAYLTNMGCWCEFIPGWQSANGARIAEPLLVDPAAYFAAFTGTSLAGVWAMHKAKARWPQLGNVGLALVSVPAIWLSMGVIDVLSTRYLHFDAWPGVEQSLSLWGGEFYQFPLYEFLIFPAAFVAGALVLYHVDANGYSILERGITKVAAPPAWTTTLRVLAFIAFCNVLNLTYTAGMGVLTLTADPWPLNMPSWLTNEQVDSLR